MISPKTPVYHKGISPSKSAFRHLNEFRARVIRFLACPTPGLRNSVPLFGGRTVVELFAMAAITVTSLGVAISGGSINAANVCGLFCILLALRYNLLLRFFNLSFERALFWHKIFAIFFLSTMIVHANAVGVNSSGLLIVICAFFMSAVYLLKPYQFEVFYYLHLLCLVLLCLACVIHGALLVFLGGLIWIGDLVLRYGFFAKRISAKAFVLPGNVVRFEFPHCFSYEAGQYCFFRIYNINRFEFHPFSLSSSPHDATTTVHIRALGDWTQKLLDYVQAEQGLLKDQSEGVPIDLLCEGPFGMSMIDWENTKDYEVFLLVSGGVGITPLQSVFYELIYANQNLGRRIRKAVFVWSVKDLELVDAFGDAERGDYTHAISHIGAPGAEISRPKSISLDSLPRNFQPMIPEVPEVFYNSFDEEEESTGNELRKSRDVEENDDVTKYRSPTPLNSVPRASSLSDSVYSIASTLVFLPRFHLTSLKTKDAVRAKNEDPSRQYILKPGRPDLKQIFRELEEMCSKERIRRVAVLVCGPQAMVSDVDDLCRESKMTCGGVRFDCHKEVFDF